MNYRIFAGVRGLLVNKELLIENESVGNYFTRGVWKWGLKEGL